MTQNNLHSNLSAPGVPHVENIPSSSEMDPYRGAIRMGHFGPFPFPGPREGLAHRGRLQRCQRKSEFGTGSLASPLWFLSEGFGLRLAIILNERPGQKKGTNGCCCLMCM